MLNKKTLTILLSAIALTLVAAFVIIFFVDNDPKKKDSDGDGIPDIYDEEVEDSLEGDNRVDIGDFFG